MEYVKLNNGVEMPILGYGVYQVTPEECERCVSDAIKIGYRSIDTAQAYHNEEGVGRAVRKSGIPREEFFITTKVWITNGGYEKAKASIDESLLPEFGRSVLEVLRQPLEDKKIVVSRARYSVEYPANFTLVAAMNPCPCGYYNHPTNECTCPPGAVHRYMGRISGPLLDRIDLQVEVTPVAIGEISQVRPSEPSAAIRERVIRAREVQAERFREVPGVHTNAMMNARMLREFCPLDQVARELLERAMVRLDLSARAYDRIVKVARTIADLEGTADIGAAHLAEAINYRSLDRGSWGR